MVLGRKNGAQQDVHIPQLMLAQATVRAGAKETVSAMARRGWNFLLAALHMVGTWGMERQEADLGAVGTGHPAAEDEGPPASAESAPASGSSAPATNMEADQAALEDRMGRAAPTADMRVSHLPIGAGVQGSGHGGRNPPGRHPGG